MFFDSLMYFFRLIRGGNLLILLFTQYMVRLCLTEEGISKGIVHLWDLDMGILALATMLIAGAGYIINDYYDIKIDTINKPERIIVGKHISRRQAMFVNIVFNALALGITWWFLKPVVLAINFGSIFLLWLYSNQLKRLPLVGNLSIAILSALSVALLAFQFPQNTYLVFVFAVFAFFITLIREIVKDMEDVHGDATFGCQTLPIVWGQRRTKTVVYVFFGIFILILLSTYISFPSRFAFYLYLVELPMLSYFIYKFRLADTKKRFHHLSQICKIIMLLGVLSMFLV